MKFRTGNRQNDEEQGPGGSEGIARPGGSAQPQHESPDEHSEIEASVEGMNGRNDTSRSPEEPHELHQDIDDSTNDLWSLYGKEAKSYDETQMKALKDDMDGVLIFAGLFSGVLTAFVVPQIQDLQVNPTVQSVYYQNQSVQMLDRISQQLASAGNQISTTFTPPSPYPTFHPSSSDRRVNIFWLISLVCSLSAALLATLVQQWARGYMRIFQQSGNPLKTARIRLFWFEGAERLPAVAETVPGLLHVSLILFFWGLGDVILQIDTTVFVTTVVPIGVGVCLYLYCAIEPIWNPQSPYRTPLSGFIWNLFQTLHRSSYYNYFREVVGPASMEIRRELTAMKESKGRLGRDVRAVQWLVDNINGSNEMRTLILAIPGLFNQKWGRDVLKGVVNDDPQSTSTDIPQIQPRPGLPSPREGTTVRSLCRSVRYHLNTYSKEEDVKDMKEQHRRLCACVETVACLVCCTGVELGLFGEVGDLLSALGDKERTNDPLTIRSNPLFTVRWTCLSLVAIWKMLDGNRLQELAKFALDGIARFQTDYGGPDAVALTAAQTIDDYLKKAWAPVEDLYLAFEPWSQNRSKSEIKGILNSHEASISELEDIAIEAVGMEDVDWRISLLQDTMDGATHRLTRHLPGVFFNELKPTAPIMISEAFNFAPVETPLVLPQLIFPGQQLQSLCSLGQRLRDIIEGQNVERHDETLKSLKSLRDVPIPLRELHPLPDETATMAQQLSSTSSSSELEEIFYTGTFKVVTSNWNKSKNSAGTQRILLDLLCDLVIRSRGVFSDFSYPSYIVDMLLDLVEQMVKGHRGERPHINDIIQELKYFNFWDRMDNSLRDKALRAIGSSHLIYLFAPQDWTKPLRYWRNLWSSLDFADQPLESCVGIIHTDIVEIWNLYDKNRYLSSDQFKINMSHVAKDLAVPAGGVLLGLDWNGSGDKFADWICDVYRGSQEHVQCVMGYIVNLTVILDDIFRTAGGNVTENAALKVMGTHVRSGRRDRIHRDIRGFVRFVIRSPVRPAPQKDLVLEKIIDLIRQYCSPFRE